MPVTIKCGEGEHCQHCKFNGTFNSANHPVHFSKNKLGRCDWFSDKPGSSKHIIKNVT
ncbi:hypothetical protein GCM10011332_27760 [Terasakiella brassicae]|uniref:Uncharacterized protein n=1 Tax=Terasakiella brassicae TaxID=1634917 RepID=A0A917C4U6_9PROT|nr:hypothetical protein [Terasakiella brassicae]GGF72244.1 hypothetical protein GCM10011332_27760 [Terasakiella brassicae]